MSQALQNSLGRISRNRIINPDSAIDQRNNGALVTVSGYTVDRQQVPMVAGKLSSQQYSVILGTAQPTNTSHKIAVVSSYSPAAGDFNRREQAIEGFRMRDALWGSSFARSFVYTVCGQWPVAGVYSVAVRNGAANRSYVTTFTVANANTLETHSVVIPGDVTGTWPVDNTTHSVVCLNAGCGSTYTTSTLNAWQAGFFLKAAGSIDLVSQVNGSAMYIAWEQYERDMRTDFEVVPYEEQLRQCQRYLQHMYSEDMVAGVASISDRAWLHWHTKTDMRGIPTLSLAGTDGFSLSDDYAADYYAASPVIQGYNTGVSGGRVNISGFTGLTVGRAYNGMHNGTNRGYVRLSSEL